MKKILIICVLILTYQIAIAQNKITGKITDNITGEAVAGATVYLPELKTGTIADKEGVYKIDNLPILLFFSPPLGGMGGETKGTG